MDVRESPVHTPATENQSLDLLTVCWTEDWTFSPPCCPRWFCTASPFYRRRWFCPVLLPRCRSRPTSLFLLLFHRQLVQQPFTVWHRVTPQLTLSMLTLLGRLSQAVALCKLSWRSSPVLLHRPPRQKCQLSLSIQRPRLRSFLPPLHQVLSLYQVHQALSPLRLHPGHSSSHPRLRTALTPLLSLLPSRRLA